MRFMMVVAALALAGPAGAVEDVDGSFGKLAPAFQSAIRSSLDVMMADGLSARLREVRVPNPQYDPDGVCFLINAKNKMGAYSGYQSGLFDLATKEVYLHRDMGQDDSRDRLRRYHYRLCS